MLTTVSMTLRAFLFKKDIDLYPKVSKQTSNDSYLIFSFI